MATRVAIGVNRALRSVVATGSSAATLPLRLFLGLIFLAHGAQKLFGLFGGGGPAGTAAGFEQMGFTPGMLWAVLAGLIEFGGGLLLIVGLLVRPASIALALQMLAVIFAVHWKNGFFADKGGIEFPLALFAGMVALAIYGAGRGSIDRAITR